jgi:hypothetical protein
LFFWSFGAHHTLCYFRAILSCDKVQHPAKPFTLESFKLGIVVSHTFIYLLRVLAQLGNQRDDVVFCFITEINGLGCCH